MTKQQRSGGFDRIILSVGTTEQKKLLSSMFAEEFRRYGDRLRIVADGENGERLGSGGALLRTLLELRQENGFENGRLLQINCGGLSRRIANYAYCSKAAVPVRSGEAQGDQTCVAHILRNAELLCARMAPGVLVCCADIPIDASAFTGALSENTSFCIGVPASVGARHGVMAPDAAGMLMAYYQKAPEQVLLSAAADASETVNAEAGWTYFTAETAALLAAAAADHAAQNGGLPAANLYEDVLPLFAPRTDKALYLGADRNGLRTCLASRLQNAAMRVIRLDQPFLHFGTLSELLNNLSRFSPEYERFLFHSLPDAQVRIGAGTLLDHARVSGNSVIGARCVLSDIDLRDVTVPDGTSVFGIRLRDGRFVTVVFAIEADARCAAETADALWQKALFYPANGFSESLRRYFSKPEGEPGLSLPECLALADAAAFLDRRRFLEDLLRTARNVNVRYAEYRARILSAYFRECAPLEALRCERERVEMQLPVRVNFSGTWTDCMPYCIENGGAVVNAAITVEGARPISISAQRIPEKRIEFCNGETPGLFSVYDHEKEVPDFSEYSLHRAVFRTLLDEKTKLTDGVRLTVKVSGLMHGSGLGVSSILLYGCFSVLGELLGLSFTEERLLQLTFVAEQLMHTGGGWQDQGAVVGGGIKVVSAPAGLPQRISVDRVEAAPDFLLQLSERLVLIPTGRRHFGRFIVTDVMSRYLTGENRAAFLEMEALNAPLIQSVRSGDTALFAETVNAHSDCLSRFSPLIYGEDLPALRETCLQYADACSICGAGGGGYLWALRKETVPEATLRQALRTEVKAARIVC